MCTETHICREAAHCGTLLDRSHHPYHEGVEMRERGQALNWCKSELLAVLLKPFVDNIQRDDSALERNALLSVAAG